jgi:hypothetical protein
VVGEPEADDNSREIALRMVLGVGGQEGFRGKTFCVSQVPIWVGCLKGLVGGLEGGEVGMGVVAGHYVQGLPEGLHLGWGDGRVSQERTEGVHRAVGVGLRLHIEGAGVEGGLGCVALLPVCRLAGGKGPWGRGRGWVLQRGCEGDPPIARIAIAALNNVGGMLLRARLFQGHVWEEPQPETM